MPKQPPSGPAAPPVGLITDWAVVAGQGRFEVGIAQAPFAGSFCLTLAGKGTAPGFPAADLPQRRCQFFSFDSRVEFGLCLGWRDAPDGLEETAIVEPVHPFQRRVFHGL